ncbi:ImmA/IrrE family metallo-endopeptidase [Mitsuokella jalaludinii]|uniref:ImmA/IrrE family metallo-endopeptidase n=1 Tax=Mitsuokella jalaludinii TaxID=187979 RepID=UPI00242A5295|nr:ImmA/IrrE family metallo-endopeptidase [Mitsuokella jalaludinii]
MMKTKRKRNLPAKPDWYFVDARVEDFWAAVDFEPPLNLLDIFRAGGCTVKTYQELSQKLDISVDEVAARFGSDDGCLFYDARHDRYRLAYDCSTRPRTRWTLAHELGHIVLRHLEDFPETSITRTQSPVLLDILDKEADKFAGDILAPAPLLIGLAESSHLHTKEFYYALSRDLFGLSIQAAHYRARFIYRYRDKITKHWTDAKPAVYQKHMNKFLALYGGLGPDTLAGRYWMEKYIKEYQRYEEPERCPAASGE